MVSDRYLAQHQLEEIIADAMREVCFYYSDYSGYSRAVPCCTMLHDVAPCCTMLHARNTAQALLPPIPGSTWPASGESIPFSQVIHEKPDDPHTFLSNQIMKHAKKPSFLPPLSISQKSAHWHCKDGLVQKWTRDFDWVYKSDQP